MEVLLAQGKGNPSAGSPRFTDALWKQCYGYKAAYWSWFESVDERSNAQALFDEAAAWGSKERSCSRIIGPMSPSANDLVGTLIEGLDEAPPSSS